MSDELRVTSSDIRVTSSNPRIKRLKARTSRLEAQVDIWIMTFSSAPSFKHYSGN